ncbi:hypothetical protein ACH4A8_37525 [Streptomyces vietnamensis]|uniref:hypothetical protein n=1 Tax=Streptomyces vietnamensis TaxID=362257 RepID=UPI0037BA70F4
MTTYPSRSLLLGLALLLAGAGVLLHGIDPEPRPAQDDARPAAVRTAPPAATHPAAPARPAAGPEGVDDAPSSDRTTDTPTARPDASTRPVPSDQPVSGDGPVGDYAIQRLLDRATPTDFPPVTARHLTRLATRVWIAETTGTGRSTWPAYFTSTDLRAPYHDVRVQAAVAHRTGWLADRAEVRLVWAGADASGEFRDGRTARVLLKFHHNEWEPVR